MTSDPKDRDPADVESLNADASKLMKRGIQLLNDGRHDAVAEALLYFDRALDIRLGLPYHSAPLLRYGLAACWLNKADALARLGGPADLAAALRAYDEGIAVLHDLPMADDPRFPRRLAMAHQNRGLALHAKGESTDAVAALGEAVAVLDRDEAAQIPDRQYLRAAIWLNIATVQASLETPQSSANGRLAALRALALVAELETDDADAAEAGLKARHVLCRTVADLLAHSDGAGETMPEAVHDATDAVDEGLALVRQWEQKGVSRFRTLAYDLFRFGARVYARYQPQFVDEFVHENMNPARSSTAYVESDEMQSAAREAMTLIRRQP